MTTPAIQLIDVSYRYPRSKNTVIRGINLTVEPGEFLAIMGENGAGKSTLCRILNGIIPHSIGGQLKGKVKIAGLNTREANIAQLSTKVGIVLDDPETQLFTTSVRSEVAFGPENLNVDPEEIYQRIQWSLDVVRLTGYEDRMPSALSGGQKQRLAIAAALAMKPEILILDEATSQVDPLGVVEVLSVVKELNEKYGMTIVMTTDQSEEIAKLADRVIVLDKGRLIAEGTPRQVFADAELFSHHMIRAPQVSQLGVQLKEAGYPLPVFPITIEEAARGIVEILSDKSSHNSLGDNIVVTPLSSFRPNEPPIIQVDNLNYIYQPHNVHAVMNVSFSVPRGEFMAIIGQNGSGKTTVLKNLLGLLRPTSGRVTVAGLNTSRAAVADMARHVGFVLQNPDQQLFAETVEEEIAFGPRNLGLSENEVRERVEEVLSIVDLQELRNEFPPALSKGERAKVVIASALALDPQIIVLDEPTTGQDYKGCHQIMQIARALNQTGHTVVFVTHHMALVAEYARRVIVMRGGQILLDGSTEEIFSQIEIVRQAHIIPPQITELGQYLPESLGLPRTPLSVDQMARAIITRLNGKINS